MCKTGKKKGTTKVSGRGSRSHNKLLLAVPPPSFISLNLSPSVFYNSFLLRALLISLAILLIFFHYWSQIRAALPSHIYLKVSVAVSFTLLSCQTPSYSKQVQQWRSHRKKTVYSIKVKAVMCITYDNIVILMQNKP